MLVEREEKHLKNLRKNGFELKKFLVLAYLYWNQNPHDSMK